MKNALILVMLLSAGAASATPNPPAVPASPPQDTLQAGAWLLTVLPGATPRSDPGARRAQVSFSGDAFHAFLGCNHANGSYVERPRQAIQIRTMAVT